MSRENVHVAARFRPVSDIEEKMEPDPSEEVGFALSLHAVPFIVSLQWAAAFWAHACVTGCMLMLFCGRRPACLDPPVCPSQICWSTAYVQRWHVRAAFSLSVCAHRLPLACSSRCSSTRSSKSWRCARPPRANGAELPRADAKTHVRAVPRVRVLPFVDGWCVLCADNFIFDKGAWVLRVRRCVYVRKESDGVETVC